MKKILIVFGTADRAAQKQQTFQRRKAFITKFVLLPST
jgi:hypothetical protein